MDAKVVWKHGLSFTGLADTGFELPLGADPSVGGENDGFRPMELFAIGLAACTGMDVISILRKKQQDVTAFEVRTHVNRTDQHPKVFSAVEVEYVVSGRSIDPAAVERSVELSITKYCPAQAMLSKAVPITHKITIIEA
ncbi:MAG TPA: OsmC family protein [Anaerolineaceae bacterium]